MANENKQAKSTGQLWFLGTISLLLLGVIIGLVHHSIVPGVTTVLLYALEIFAFSKLFKNMDDGKDPEPKSMGLCCAAVWGLGMGTLAGLLEWKLIAFAIVGGAWGVIGFFFAFFVTRLDNKNQARIKQEVERKAAEQEQSEQ